MLRISPEILRGRLLMKRTIPIAIGTRPVVRLLNWESRFIFRIEIFYPNLILRKLFRPKNERISLFHNAS